MLMDVKVTGECEGREFCYTAKTPDDLYEFFDNRSWKFLDDVRYSNIEIVVFDGELISEDIDTLRKAASARPTSDCLITDWRPSADLGVKRLKAIRVSEETPEAAIEAYLSQIMEACDEGLNYSSGHAVSREDIFAMRRMFKVTGYFGATPTHTIQVDDPRFDHLFQEPGLTPKF